MEDTENEDKGGILVEVGLQLKRAYQLATVLILWFIPRTQKGGRKVGEINSWLSYCI
jgi:hypothetical protein